MRLTLAPGLRLVRREAGVLQIGIDPPRRAVLADSPGVRRLVDQLVVGRVSQRLAGDAGRALEALTAAGLTASPEHGASQRDARRTARVHVEAPEPYADPLRHALAEAGLRRARSRDEATHALVVGEGAVARGRLDDWSRDGVPHLVVTDAGEAWTLGPYVLPGTTACLRCVDAHASEADPRRGLVVEQVARLAALTPSEPNPSLTALALAWAVRDLVIGVEGGRPSTWSATVEVGVGAPIVAHWSRHPYCGCTWADDLTA